MAESVAKRDRRGRFLKKKINKKPRKSYPSVEHNYSFAEGSTSQADCEEELNGVDLEGWKVGRRIVEFDVLLEGLRYCQKCQLGPVPLTVYSLLGERKKGLGGYLYVRCQNHDCQAVNRVPYGKTHHQKTKGMPCFVVNTKLGLGEYSCILVHVSYIHMYIIDK